jgi:hypothetical protein
MAAKINKNRYRLITLLYVIFVCLSVLNIPATLLDSNYYSIKTLEYQEQARLKQVNFANRLIEEQQLKLISDTARVYINIQARIHKSYEYMDRYDQLIQKTMADQNTDVFKEFNSKRKIEALFLKDSNVYKIRDEFFDLIRYLNTQPFQIDQAIKKLVPVSEVVITQSGKELEWERYLFLHKPTAISYFHVKRLKLLLLDNENIYQNAILKTIGYLPAYYSEAENRAVMDKANSVPTVIDNSALRDSIRKADSAANAVRTARANPDKAENTAKVVPKDATAKYPKYPVQADSVYSKATNTDNFDQFIQRIITSLHSENYFVGIANPVLKEFNYFLGTDFGFEIVPKGGEITQVGFNYSITFRNTGEYTFKFTDKRNGANKQVFEKKVRVYLFPNPLVKLNGDNNIVREIVNVKDLFAANRLVGYLNINDLPNFPGRINGFRVTRIGAKEDKRSIYNYGEVFGPELQNLITTLQKGEFILFDNITCSMVDGTTRTANPLTFKIVD